MPLDIACGLDCMIKERPHGFGSKPHQITRTDHARFEGSELRVLSSDDRISAVRVLESVFLVHQGHIVTLQTNENKLTSKPQGF
jgi:hypothetical protein